MPLLARTASLARRYPCSNCAANPAEPAPAPKEILLSPTNPEVAAGTGVCEAAADADPRSAPLGSPLRSRISFWPVIPTVRSGALLNEEV